MTAKLDLASGWKSVCWAIVLAVAAALPGFGQVSIAAEPVGVTLDQAMILKLPENVATIVIGNPAIADVSVQSGGLVVVTGKGYGSTNFVALDRSGAVLMERSILVRGPSDNTVVVYRGMERETHSCTPNCERRITLGDSPNFFTATLGQSNARTGQAIGLSRPQSR